MMHSLFLLSVLLLRGATVYASESTTSFKVSVLDLGKKNFTEELSTETYAKSHCLIEFYAHWCPHCQQYRPTYEKIGRFFNGSPRPEPVIWVARVDCAIRENIPLCDKFNVVGYPTLYFGKTLDFVEYKTGKLHKVPAKDPPAVVHFLGSLLDAKYEYKDKSTLIKVTPRMQERKERKDRMDLDDVERATVELFDRLFRSRVILRSRKVRSAFIQWVRLLAGSHPSTRCRRGAHFLLNRMDTFWPARADKPKEYISRFRLCTVSYEKKDWGSCAGSVPGKRGFTCGLWQLLHALSVGVEEHGVNTWISGVRSFTKYFFGCEECAKHFMQKLKTDGVDQIDSRDELVMWLWTTHNAVNKRLANEELTSGTGDPAFPKVQWPPENLCSRCHTKFSSEETVDWDEGRIRRFMYKFYSADTLDEKVTSFIRKELRNGVQELSFTDVFSKEDATAIELNTAKASVHRSSYVLVGMVVLVILIVRYSKKRKLVPPGKDIL